MFDVINYLLILLFGFHWKNQYVLIWLLQFKLLGIHAQESFTGSTTEMSNEGFKVEMYMGPPLS